VHLPWKSTYTCPLSTPCANARVPALQLRASMTVHLYVPPLSGPVLLEHAHSYKQKRSSALALAVGGGTRELPSSFTPPQPTSPLSAFMFVPAYGQSAYIPAIDVDVGIQDEWVALTRNLTLLSSRGPIEPESVMCSSREETMMVCIRTWLCPPESISSALMRSPYAGIYHAEPRRAPSTFRPAVFTRTTPPAWCSTVTTSRR
jgi:hypothetical protein